MEHELGDLLGPVVSTVTFDQPIDQGFDLKQLRSCSIFRRQVEQQMAVNSFGLTP